MINKFILKEGLKPVVYSLIFTLISALFICSFLTTVLAIVTILLAYIYRVPSNNFVQTKDVISPTDGIVTAIDIVNNKRIIYIKLGLFDTHVLRAPISSTYKITKRRHGANLSGNSFKANQINDKITLKFNKIKVDLLADQCNFILKVDEQKEISQHEKFAIMTSGEVKITLEKNMLSKIKIGQNVYAGVTPLA